MYDMNDLFNSRDVVGCKLNQIIGSHKYTKSNVCTGAGISRPTLDKLLNGEVTNKTNFEKHISKLLAFLSLTPSELMGGIANPFTDSKTLRDALHLDLQQLSQRCGLSIDELQKIEAGEDVPLAELRDVAYCLGTGVTGVLGDGYFQTPVSSMNYFVKNDSTTIHERRLQGAVIHKTPPASCHGNRGRCDFMGNASGAAKPQCSRELTHARAAVLAWSLLYIFRVVLYTFWLMALLALVAAACLASSVSAAATAAFISA